jgi:hypothetical protein
MTPKQFAQALTTETGSKSVALAKLLNAINAGRAPRKPARWLDRVVANLWEDAEKLASARAVIGI